MILVCDGWNNCASLHSVTRPKVLLSKPTIITSSDSERFSDGTMEEGTEDKGDDFSENRFDVVNKIK